MTRRYVNVISECDIGGALWPRIIFLDNRRLAIDKIFHTYSINPVEPGGPLWNSFRCLIKGKTMNVTFEGKTNKWFLTQRKDRLYY